MAVAKHHHAGSGVKTLEELGAPLRIQPLKQGAVRPIFEFLLRHQQLVLDFNAEDPKTHRQGRRQIHLRRVDIPADCMDFGKAPKVIQNGFRAYVSCVQDGIHSCQDVSELRINISMRVRNHSDFHSPPPTVEP